MRQTLRILPLSLCIAAALPARAADKYPMDWSRCPTRQPVPIFGEAVPSGDESKTPRNKLPTTLEGDEQTGTIDTPIFTGNVNLNRGNQFLGSDKLTYDREKDTYVAEGNVRYSDERMRILAERAEGNQATDTHTISNIKYQVVTKRGNGSADKIVMNNGIGQLYGANYSTCPPEKRDWQIEASRIDVNTEEGMAVAHAAKIRIGKVPVAYIPVFKFPIDDRRRTGLLYPSISQSRRNGFDIRQPIYLNLAPNYDATLTPRVMTSRGVSLDSEFRYLNASGAGTVGAMYMPYDKLRKTSRGSFTYNAFQNLNSNWQARANLMWLSDPRYFEDFNNSSAGISQYSAYSVIGLYGVGHRWNASFTADRWQRADYTLTNAFLPYDRLPRAAFSWESPLGVLFRAGVDVEAVRFQHQSYRNFDPVALTRGTYIQTGSRIAMPGGSRFDLKPFISMPIEGAWWFARPTLAWRYTAYRVDGGLANCLAKARSLGMAGGTTGINCAGVNAANVPQASWQPLVAKNPTRSVPIFSLDTGVYFDRQAIWRGKSYVQTLEPRLFYLRAPYRDQSMLPIFDTAPMTFSWGQLFRDNRYSSADRQSDANQITMAVTTRMNRESDGKEKLSASLGRINYLSDVRVLYPGEKIITKGSSAWVADANYAINDNWGIGASYQWDPKSKKRDLVSIRTRYLWGEDGVANLSYRYRRNLLEQADLNFLYPINDAWSLVGRYYVSLRDEQWKRAVKPLEMLAGVQWDSCCVAARFVARRFVGNRKGDLRTAFMMEFELKGLGSAGQDSRRVLRRAILGYFRDDLYLVPPETATGQPITDPDPSQ